MLRMVAEMQRPAATKPASVATVATGPDAGALYELVGPLREILRERGWSQGALAEAAHITRPNVASILNGRTRITERKALAICGALEVKIDDMFLRVLPLASAARVLRVGRQTLLEAALDERSPIVPHAVEKRDSKIRVYFVEENLREQIDALPECKAACRRRAFSRSGYCSEHKWKAAHDHARRAIAKSAEERPWLTEDEAARLTGRAWDVIHSACLAGDLRSLKVGSCRIIPKTELERWDADRPPGLRSVAWQEETNGIVSLYESGKDHRTIARRARRNPKTVLARLRLREVVIRPSATEDWEYGTAGLQSKRLDHRKPKRSGRERGRRARQEGKGAVRARRMSNALPSASSSTK